MTLKEELAERIGPGKVRDDEITLVTYGRICHGFDHMAPFRRPSLVVFPETRQDVCETLKIANVYKVPVTVVGTAPIMAGTTEGGIILDQRRRDKILEINTDAGYAVVEPGVTFDKLMAALKGTGFKCSVGTMPGSATVLGQALSRGSQSFSTRYLSLVLDLEVVLPDGTVFTTGSSHFDGVGSHLRYGPFPDMAGLFTCGYGAFGVVTKAAIRIHPVNQVYKVHFAGFDRYADSVEYVKAIVGNNIPEHAVIWNWHMYLTWPLSPSDLRSWLPLVLNSDARRPPEGVPYNLVTSFLSGYEEVVEVYEKVCDRVARSLKGIVLSEEEMARRFPHTLSGFRDQYGMYPRHREAVHWCKGRFVGFYAFAAPKDIKEVERFAVDEFSGFGSAINPVNYYSHPFDFGRSFLLRIGGFPDPMETELRGKMLERIEQMQEKALREFGAVPIRPLGMWGKVGPFMDVLRRIKGALDPNNILGRDSGLFDRGSR